MSARKILIGALLVVVGLPLLLALAAAVSIHLLDRTSGTVVSGGEKRQYLLHVPSSHDPARPAPLVISLHGAMGWPALQMATDRWNRVADEHGFLVVYPAGTELPLGPRIWRRRPGAGLAADVGFIAELIDTLQAAYAIDSARVYVSGLSAGGGLAFALSCRLSDRIAAVGTVAAAQSLPWSWCADPRPVPMIAFHGTADRLVPYAGGRAGDPLSAGALPSVTAWTASWARRNRCAPTPVETPVAPDVGRLEYGGCAGEAAVVLYTVRGGGHSWPGGGELPAWLVGPTSRSIDATGEMWAFFRRHRLAQRNRKPAGSDAVERPAA